MTYAQTLGALIVWTLAACTVYDLAFCRPERLRRRRAEARARRLHAELDRRDRGDLVHQVTPITSTTAATVTQLRPGGPVRHPRRTSRHEPRETA